jgi:HAE1 family hydrophobic/amphiphilic exporter-1
VGGLVVSQLLTLYITPVYYTYLDSLQHALSRLLRRRRLQPDTAAAAEPSEVGVEKSGMA